MQSCVQVNNNHSRHLLFHGYGELSRSPTKILTYTTEDSHSKCTLYDYEKRVLSASVALAFRVCFFNSCRVHRLFSTSDRTCMNSCTTASKPDPTDSYARSAAVHRLSSCSVSAIDLSSSDLQHKQTTQWMHRITC